MWRSDDRSVPVRAIFKILGLFAKDVLRIGFDRAGPLGLVVVFGERAVDGRGIDQTRVVLIKGNMRALTTTHRIVVIDADATPR